jgi:hypothetical protein
MSTTNNRTQLIASALGAAVAGAAAPALLFLSAGTAQAHAGVSATSDALGVTIEIRSAGVEAEKSWGACLYTAIPDYSTTPAGELPPLPVYNVPFELTKGGLHHLWFPGFQTGTMWDVFVTCENGKNNPSAKKVLY